MNILAIDFGTKRIGLAWAQPEMGVVLPYGVVGSKEEIVTRIREEGIQQIVLGLPYQLESGDETDHTAAIREVGEWLESEAGVVVQYVDERLSSKMADAMPGDISRDEKAAMVLLQHYLDSQK